MSGSVRFFTQELWLGLFHAHIVRFLVQVSDSQYLICVFVWFIVQVKSFWDSLLSIYQHITRRGSVCRRINSTIEFSERGCPCGSAASHSFRWLRRWWARNRWDADSWGRESGAWGSETGALREVNVQITS